MCPKHPHLVPSLGTEKKIKLCQIIVEYPKLKQTTLQLQLVHQHMVLIHRYSNVMQPLALGVWLLIKVKNSLEKPSVREFKSQAQRGDSRNNYGQQIIHIQIQKTV